MNPQVETRSGRVEGRDEREVVVFRGIPYASPPRDALRFHSPQAAETWSATRVAHDFGSAAPQVGPVNRLVRMMIGAAGRKQSQDCLYLNVWTPAADGRRRPVMVFVHGGAFILGSGAARLWHGGYLAARGDVVVVTLNYRLGALGYLSWRSIEEGDAAPPANLGLRDQIAALAWVRDNIEAFGGDPENVTLFGESAGAMSVATILGTPAAKGLFHKAILQSGAAHNVSEPVRADEVAQQFFEELGHPTPDALRALPVGELMRAQALTSAKLGITRGVLAWQPCVDGDILPEQPLAAIDRGLSAEVPLLIGTNRDEWKLFMIGDPQGLRLDEEGLRRRLRDSFDREEDGARAIEAYLHVKGERGGEPSDRWAAFQSDRVFHYPAMRLADAQSRHQSQTYAYQFEWAPMLADERVGSCHGLELPFVFGTLRAPWLRWLGLSPRARRLSDKMQDAWLAFARTGVPATDRLPDWPSYSTVSRNTMGLAHACSLREDPHARGRGFWESILRDPRGQAHSSSTVDAAG